MLSEHQGEPNAAIIIIIIIITEGVDTVLSSVATEVTMATLCPPILTTHPAGKTPLVMTPRPDGATIQVKDEVRHS